MTSIKKVETTSAPAPVGPYSQAIKAGKWLFCSGQIALDPISGEMKGQSDIQEEAKQVLKNLFAVIHEAGAKSTDIVKTTIYLVDLKDFEKVNKVYSDFFKADTSPARACVEVAGLPKGGKVEIDCIAWIRSK